MAAVAAFAASSVDYVVFGKAVAALLAADFVAVDMRRVPASRRPPSLFVASSSRLWSHPCVVRFGVVDWEGALRLAFLVWVGFPFMILTGAVLWDNRPWKFAAIHMGDWLMKLVMMAVILGMWHS